MEILNSWDAQKNAKEVFDKNLENVLILVNKKINISIHNGEMFTFIKLNGNKNIKEKTANAIKSILEELGYKVYIMSYPVSYGFQISWDE